MTLKFFTNGTWYPRYSVMAQVKAPVGESCLACDKPIEAEDCGVSMIHSDAKGDAYHPWHLVCFRASIGLAVSEA